MRSARFIAAVVLCCACALPSVAQTQQEQTRAEKEITAIVHQMYDAEMRKDLNFVLAHLAADFAEVAGDGGVYHRADIEAGWADVALHSYSMTDCIFKLLTRDAAYLSCKLEGDVTYKGQPLPKLFRVTTIWTRQKGEWLIRFEQGTIIPPASKSPGSE